MGIFLAEKLNVMAPRCCEYFIKIFRYLDESIGNHFIAIKSNNLKYNNICLEIDEIVLYFMANKKY
jgi:hypothetical protein